MGLFCALTLLVLVAGGIVALHLLDRLYGYERRHPMFQGFVELESTLPVADLVTTSAGVPVNSDSLPTYRVYGPDGLLALVAGSLAKKDTGSITGATNASPIVVTSAGHGLTTGTRVTVSGVGGNSAANGTFMVTAVDADTFSLDSSTGNGAYTSGGAWNVTGLYGVTLTCSAANGFESGETYTVLVSGAVSATAFAHLHTFTVA